jgi:hypothetical protein
MELHVPPQSLPGPTHPPRPAGRPPYGARQRLRRVLVAACLLALVPVVFSYATAMLQPSDSSLGIRSVEWLRDHGAAGLVIKVESIYYSLTAPAKGGPALHALPHVGVVSASAGRSPASIGKAFAPTGASSTALPTVDRPARVRTLTRPALPGEGVWHPTQVGESTTDPPLLVSTFRSDPSEYPRLVAGVAWINTSNTIVSMYAGRLEPSVELPSRGPMEVPPRYRHRLLATFNSGFKLADSGGGWALYGRTYAPMTDGRATFVRYADGRYDVINWHGGPRVPANVMFARQNLPLIVDDAIPNPNLNDGPEWGATLGNAILVWRSAIGVDRRGNLLYAAAPDQTVRSLADILIHAGAVRAMELDINSYWTSCITYAGADALDPSNLLSGMERPSSRYLSPDDRDFFAVYSR